MALAVSLKDHLDRMRIRYEVIPHAATPSTSRTAEATHVPGDKVAKGVLVRDKDGYTLAVLPASCHLRLPNLGALLGVGVALATEQEVDQIFTDCAHGAIPPIGGAYGLDTVVDDRLMERDEVYFEGGDHVSLVRVSAPDLEKLMADARRARFAEHD
jgi:Ala-tRNA(Pro) deacylase